RRAQRESKCVFLYSAPGPGRSPGVCWNRDICVPRDRIGAWRIIHCRCHAVFESPHQGSCACVIYYIDCLPASFAGCTCPDKVMNTSSATMNQTPTRGGVAWKLALILIPIVTLLLLLWLRHIEVAALRQRTVSSYGTVPSFQLVN